MKKKLSFHVPHVYVIIATIILIVAALTWIIPAGGFDTEEVEVNGVTREVAIPGTFKYLDESNPTTPIDLLSSLHKGLVAGAEVTMLIFLVNGAFKMVIDSGTFDAFLGRMLKRYSKKAKILIPIAFFIFAAGSSMFGMVNEYNGLIPVMMALGIALGYDALAGCAILILGRDIGWSAGTLNPYTVPVSQSIAGLPLYSAMGFRVVAFFIFGIIGIAYIFYYGQKIAKDPSKSLMNGVQLEMDFSKDSMETAVITKKHKIIMTCVVVCIGIILWGTLKAGWGNPELAGMFAFMGIFAGFVDGLKPSEIAEEFVKGAAGITMGALVVGLARAILVIVQDAMIIDTIIYYAASLLEGLPSVLAAQGMLLLTSIINFFIPSSTGAASVSIPILAPIGDFLGVSRQVTCLAFQFGDGFSNMLWPTAGIAVSLGISGIPFDRWWRFFLPLFAILYVAQVIILSVAVLMGI